MESKSYTEVVLSPQRTRSRSSSERPSHQLPVREFRIPKNKQKAEDVSAPDDDAPRADDSRELREYVIPSAQNDLSPARAEPPGPAERSFLPVAEEKATETPPPSTPKSVAPATTEKTVTKKSKPTVSESAVEKVTPAPSPEASENKPPVVEKARKDSSQDPFRDFIIAYDGVFLGHYRSAKRITNRTAFQNVARVLASSTDDFAIEKLHLYKPVRLEVTLPGSLDEITGGQFHWFFDLEPEPTR